MEKHLKNHTKTVNLKYQLYLSLVFKIILNIFQKHGEKTDHFFNKNM